MRIKNTCFSEKGKYFHEKEQCCDKYKHSKLPSCELQTRKIMPNIFTVNMHQCLEVPKKNTM